jgi:DNA-binding CsgD family transcriptional regulator
MTAGTFCWKTDRTHQQSLYPGQREALTRRGLGATNGEIASAMNVSRQTVASYLGGAVLALGVATIDEAVEAAQKAGLTPFYRSA